MHCIKGTSEVSVPSYGLGYLWGMYFIRWYQCIYQVNELVDRFALSVHHDMLGVHVF